MITINKLDIQKDGVNVNCYTLDNGGNLKCDVMDFGATVLGITFGGKKVTMGFNNLERYVRNRKFFGSTVGRVAGRIKNGTFTLNGKEYKLKRNDKRKHHLHGEFSFRFWDASVEGDKLLLHLFSPDGDEGFDGNLDVTVAFSVTDCDELVMEYEAVCDKDTPLNLTNHTYFNLNSKGIINSHQVKINADYFIPTDDEAIPTGEIKKVDGTALDLRNLTPLGERMTCFSDPDIKAGNGIDHDFVLNKSDKSTPDAYVYSPESDLSIELVTDFDCVHLYTGNFLDRLSGGFRGGLCLETQGYSDSLNNPDFVPYVLKAGEVFKKKSVFKFKQGK